MTQFCRTFLFSPGVCQNQGAADHKGEEGVGIKGGSGTTPTPLSNGTQALDFQSYKGTRRPVTPDRRDRAGARPPGRRDRRVQWTPGAA
eukprot:761987-Hanusia_phi.AAC.3